MPITVQTFKWSEVTAVSVSREENSLKIAVANAEICLKLCPDIEQYLAKQILSNTEAITTPEPDVQPLDVCLPPNVQLTIALLVMRYKLSDSAAQDS